MHPLIDCHLRSSLSTVTGVVAFGILGPLTVHGDDGAARPLDPRQTRVLAVLVLEANRTVAVQRLIDAVWDDRPPATARRQLQNIVSTLRQQHGAMIDADGPGYRLTIHDGQLDAGDFARRVALAREHQSAGHLDEAVAELRQALRMWRGPALSGCGGRFIEAGAARLDEQRLAVTEQCLSLELRLGRQDQVIGELTELVAANPLREKMVGHLMLALHRSGRQADAVAAYERLRATMADELGLDPGTELQELRATMLRQESGPALSTVEVPRQLPAAARHFVGRGAELKELSSLIDTATVRGGTVMISALAGTAGIGKTTLALHWAHRVAESFPDGQLYVNLRGFEPTGAAIAPAEAIRGFLDALRVPAARIPASTEAQAALYRSLMADRRMLVVLDNAGDVDQVRPLLPGSGGCLVIVTSRTELTGLIAAEGAYPITLDLLTPAEARELLARHLGADRLTAEPDAVNAIVDSCARLPLALAVVAARAAARPAFPLATLAAELTDARQRLDALDTGDRSAVRAVFSWSYQRLTGPAATMFRRLGLHPGPDIGARAAASLGGVPLAKARRALAELTRTHLVSEHTPGRFGCHDLLRAYATELAHEHDPEEVRQAAVRRMADYYVASAHAAALLLSPHRDPIALALPASGAAEDSTEDPAEDFTEYQEALAWFEAEHQVLLRVAAWCLTDPALDASTFHLARALTTYLSRRGLWHDDVEVRRIAQAAARRLGDRAVEAHADRGLGRAYSRLGRYDDARIQLEHAMALFRDLGDQMGLAGAHLAVAIVHEQLDQPEQALDQNLKAHELYLAGGHRRGQADTLNAVGMCHSRLGNYAEAVAYCERALVLYQELRDRHGEAATWDSIAFAEHHLGDHERAAACYRRAIELCRVVGDRYHEADTLVRLGDTHRTTGDTAAARDVWQLALALLNELGHPAAEGVRTRLAGPL